MISILITSRIEGNENHALVKLLDSMAQYTVDPKGLEVLVKYDIGDLGGYHEAIKIINTKYPFRILCEDGPRGKGYTDIHYGYNQLLNVVSPLSRVIGAMADDFTVNAGWDRAILDAIEGAGDYFIVHQRPHPRKIWQGQPGTIDDGDDPLFCMQDDMFDSANLHIIDEAPLWSPKLLEACKLPSKLGMTFPVSFTDAWTVCLEHCLWNTYKMNLTKFLPGIVINRTCGSMDQADHIRWSTDRKSNFDYIKSNAFRQIVEDQAEEIACQLSAKVE